MRDAEISKLLVGFISGGVVVCSIVFLSSLSSKVMEENKSLKKQIQEYQVKYEGYHWHKGVLVPPDSNPDIPKNNQEK